PTGRSGRALGHAPAGRAEILRLHGDQVPDDVLGLTQRVPGQSERGHPPLREIANGSRAGCHAGHARTLAAGPDAAAPHATYRPGTVRAMRIAITGAAGGIGTVLLRRLDRSRFELLALDLEPIEVTAPDQSRRLDLRDPDQLVDAFAGVQAVVHLGAVPHEDTFETILEHNIVGTRNVYDAAVAAGVSRVVFASSAHVTGFYPWGHRTGPDDAPRPDTYYALSKLYGENLGRVFHQRFGIEVVNLRIGGFTP